MITKQKAIISLVPNIEFKSIGDNFTAVNGWELPSESDIQAEIDRLTAAEPMRLLREERDRLIALTDWRFRSDLSPSQAWIDYSQALRDLPATATPSLDENGNLTGVTWPTPPSE
tara:strand:+ start:542 stop:886 length:345 start_codon:yes stop_codon:yes gene_type:complete